jgi:hypothetical protein
MIIKKTPEVAEAIKQLRFNPAFMLLLEQLEAAATTHVRTVAYQRGDEAAWHAGRLSTLLELYDELTEAKGAASGSGN